jgi:hypothetical protein
LLEVGTGHEVRNIVVVSFGTSGLCSSLEETSDLLILLGSDLLEDIRYHILELLGLGVAGCDQQLLSHRELN